MHIDDQNQPKCDKIVVLYFGAGRGPLIRKALSAARRAQVMVQVVALDKNPNAIITLRNMIVEERLEENVSIVSGDMRNIDAKDL